MEDASQANLSFTTFKFADVGLVKEIVVFKITLAQAKCFAAFAKDMAKSSFGRGSLRSFFLGRQSFSHAGR